MTVLAPQNDPFRVDTPARHRDAEWLAVHVRELGLGDRRIHLRGLHYALLDVPKPNGVPYANRDEDWAWLSGHAAKAARWLGYLPFEQIVDHRNSPPVVRQWIRPEPMTYLTVGVEVDIPGIDEIEPQVVLGDFRGTQPYKLVIFGEKASLEDTLGPIAERYRADVYLPTGEISDTLLHEMARVGAEDGRRMVVFTFSDADPAGWQMPISIARKLQAFQALEFEDLEFEVRRVALTPEQVRAHGLPSAPLKATEKRADKWTAAMGVEQTEIDALATLRPALLRDIAIEAIAPFFDPSLDQRVFEACGDWESEAQAVLDDQLNQEQLEGLRHEAEAKLAHLRREIDAINEALRSEVNGAYGLPAVPVIPSPILASEPDGTPLISSDSSFATQTRRLIASKRYADTAFVPDRLPSVPPTHVPRATASSAAESSSASGYRGQGRLDGPAHDAYCFSTPPALPPAPSCSLRMPRARRRSS
jgi:hypothetical protein